MIKRKELFKNIGLLAILLGLALLVFYIPKSRQFEISLDSPSFFLNLGTVIRFGFAKPQSLITDDQGFTNILLMGKAGEGNPAPDLVDTIILATLKENIVNLISIPRDLYFKAETANNYQKINSFLQGIIKKDQKAAKKAIEKITGRQVHYYILGDLVLLEKIVDELGGLNLLIKEDVYDPLFPGPNYSYEPFLLAQGWRYFDGKTATKYARTRYGSEGDFGRMKRQQELLSSIKNKVENLNKFQGFNFILSLYESLKKHIVTDLGLGEIKALWQKSKEIDLEKAKAITLDSHASNLLQESYISTYSGPMFVLVPQTGADDYSMIHEYIEKILAD